MLGGFFYVFFIVEKGNNSLLLPHTHSSPPLVSYIIKSGAGLLLTSIAIRRCRGMEYPMMKKGGGGNNSSLLPSEIPRTRVHMPVI